METAASIVNMALRRISIFSPYDTAADESSFAIALECLDEILAEYVGTDNLWFFVPTTSNVPITPFEREIDISVLVSPSLEFVHDVHLLRDGANVGRIDLIRRSSFEEQDATVAAETPRTAYVERRDRAKMILWPTPMGTGLSLNVVGQKYAPNVITSKGGVETEFPKAWKRFLTLKLALDIGDGPVTTLPDDRLRRIERAMLRAEQKLQSYSNKENVRKVRYTRYRDM